MAQTKTLVVELSKADYLQTISNLNEESLKILADKSTKPGIEKKLKSMQHFF